MPTLQKPEKKSASRSISPARRLENRVIALAEELDDVRDSVLLLNARKANKGKKLYTPAEARKRLGLPPL